MPLLGEGAAHPNAPLEKTKEAFPFLLPHGREVAEGKRFPGTLREGERETERGVVRRNEEEKGRSRAQVERKEKWAQEIQSKANQPEPLRAALPPSLTAEGFKRN